MGPRARRPRSGRGARRAWPGLHGAEPPCARLRLFVRSGPLLLRSRFMVPRSLPLGLAALIAARSSANAETNSRVIPPSSTTAPAPAAPQVAAPAARASTAQANRVVYDLAAHVEHAELRRGESLI